MEDEAKKARETKKRKEKDDREKGEEPLLAWQVSNKQSFMSIQ